MMKQMIFADAECAGKRKQTRKELFLIEMDRVEPPRVSRRRHPLREWSNDEQIPEVFP